MNKTGDWGKFRNVLSGAVDRIEKEKRRGLRLAAEVMDQKITDHIDSQDLVGDVIEPISERYRERKERQGYSTDVFRRTGTYARNIAIDDSRIARGEIFVGVRRGVRTKEGDSLTEVAYVLEYGAEARGLPPRPLWAYTLAEMERPFEKIMEEAFRRAFNIKSSSHDSSAGGIA